MALNLHLGLDLDGTLADHTKTKRALAREFGYEVTENETASEILRQRMAPEHYRELQHRLFRKLADDSPKNIAVREVLRELSQRGWKLSLVSRRKEDGRHGAVTWVTRELAGLISEDRLFFVEEDAEKDVVCAKEGDPRIR